MIGLLILAVWVVSGFLGVYILLLDWKNTFGSVNVDIGDAVLLSFGAIVGGFCVFLASLMVSAITYVDSTERPKALKKVVFHLG